MMSYSIYERLSCPEYRSPYLGGQRLLIPDIISCIPRGASVLIPFAAGQELPWYLRWSGFKGDIVASDQQEISFQIGKTLVDGKGFVKCAELLAIIDRVNEREFKGWYFPGNWSLSKRHTNRFVWSVQWGEFFSVIENHPSDVAYFGSPTLLEDNSYFFERYSGLGAMNQATDKGLRFMKDNEPILVRTIMRALRDFHVSLVISGFGSGRIPISVRFDELRRIYPKTKIVVKKSFTGFTDWLLMSEY